MFAWFWKRLGFVDVLVIGSAHIDAVVDTKLPISWPQGSGKEGIRYQYGVGDVRKSIGGSGYNIAVNLAQPPDRRKHRLTVGLFTFLPSGLDLTETILRKLKVAGISTRFVRRLRHVADARGKKAALSIGSFIGVRVVEDAKPAGPVHLGRSDSIMRNEHLLSGAEEKRLTTAVGRSKIAVVDADVSPDFIRTALTASLEANVPFAVSAMSIETVSAYLEVMDEPDQTKNEALLVGARLASLDKLAESNPTLRAALTAVRQHLGDAVDPGTVVADKSVVPICDALRAKNVAIIDGLHYCVIDAAGSVLRGVVGTKTAANWMGARDACFAAILAVYASSQKRQHWSPGAKGRDAVLNPISKGERHDDTAVSVSSYVRNVLLVDGATRNSLVDTTETEHPFWEAYYKARKTVGHWVVGGVLTYMVPAILKAGLFERAWNWIFNAIRPFVKFI